MEATTVTWQRMDTAPRDGTWFAVLSPGTLVLRGDTRSLDPYLRVIRWSYSDEGWETSMLTVPDHVLAGSLWCPLNELPIERLYQELDAAAGKRIEPELSV